MYSGGTARTTSYGRYVPDAKKADPAGEETLRGSAFFKNAHRPVKDSEAIDLGKRGRRRCRLLHGGYFRRSAAFAFAPRSRTVPRVPVYRRLR
ncbi:hypothetical protein KNP414_06079 [Paenibacillus mucilaginosus KNP414]|uniref:Uncharacterized protein n=1 Tax=Paenibacillus mucilaginosus (strain KNP414) TaxID=1036673 RepID=F8FGE3_PAEMK|nr:hypothetical protein KNP414_06079 [Paenibacillus mucilaginosus KNP414]